MEKRRLSVYVPKTLPALGRRFCFLAASWTLFIYKLQVRLLDLAITLELKFRTENSRAKEPAFDWLSSPRIHEFILCNLTRRECFGALWGHKFYSISPHKFSYVVETPVFLRQGRSHFLQLE
jgi:hypothetical protein